MCKVLVFAGTTEGRKTAEFLDSQSIPSHICVATEYGEELLPKSGNMTVSHTPVSYTHLLPGCLCQERRSGTSPL